MNAANPEKTERPSDDASGLEKKIVDNAKVVVPVGT